MTEQNDPRLTRRAFLAFMAAAGASACTGPVFEVRRPSDSSTASARPSPPSSPTAGASPNVGSSEKPSPFEPLASDAFPNAKKIAGRFAEALTTYDLTAKPARVVRSAARQAHRSFNPNKAERVAKPLFLGGAESRGEVVYAQLGGLALGSGIDRACVMVVTRQHLLTDNGDSSTVTRTLDIRLINTDDRWRIEDLADAGPQPVVKPAAGLPEVARKVLDDTRIELPDTARWDILKGTTDERLLAAMLDMAAIAPYSVAVLQTGHPKNVFGTDLISAHTLGRGVDIWRVAGRPVVLQQPGKKSDAYTFTKSLLKDLKVPELGSPWDLDGPPEPGQFKPSFTDAVHADHIHVAFKAR